MKATLLEEKVLYTVRYVFGTPKRLWIWFNVILSHVISIMSFCQHSLYLWSRI